jgi:methyl-accepting chemotaxis protein
MTQQNAALVEQASAASKSMSSRSQAMFDMLERYQLGQQQGAAPGAMRRVA